MSQTPRVPAGTHGDRDLRRSLEGFAAEVVKLATVDVVTTELVRLRCASYHDCHT